ncbi:hypothetical protein GCM10007049_34200 [Echinicola pacifica]|uniref:FAD dependent oxidoreductase n=1 Tax=Echinicola pacifica TaxID=346377 RepID=A0A918QBC7_9BACT|nr:FAD-dependent oxidoreductase [Echinicola pacifica]GGZ38079.1 hypothetical protein GCM10007049_34200 [Echinicola pacifica]
MKRRKFFKQTAGAGLLSGLLPLSIRVNDDPVNLGKRSNDHWEQMGKGKIGIPKRQKTVQYDVAVIGAGMAGISAAVASARNGAKTVLINDRPVLGGNASSEIRVTVNGVQSLQNKHRVERETGIIEEMLIDNWYFNPQESYPVWDHVVYDYVSQQSNLDIMLNTQAIDAVMHDSGTIKSAICWQLTTETAFTINAKYFIDCSGDGLLAATAGAEYRTGREARSEFDESFAPEVADGWQMGATLMMITKDMEKPMPYYPPSFMIPYQAEKAHDRKINQFKEGYWWVELGSDDDIIADQETNRHKLMGYMHGVWNYIKNSGEFPEADNLVLDWVGSLPGRRESRRFMGDYILTQKDMETYKHFEDAIGYGGWSLDEHNPGGIENLSEPPSYFHDRFNKPYEVPFRSLYSKNIKNLMFAGRNVSVTHIALSSTRIQGTCALMGQAVGTAAALCLSHQLSPRMLAQNNIDLLQEQLLRDDVYIPNRPSRDPKDLARQCQVIFGDSTATGDAKLLLDGISRDEIDQIHHWSSSSKPAQLQLEWLEAQPISEVLIKADTNLQRKIMMHKNPDKNEEQILAVPPELVRELVLEARVAGAWKEIAQLSDNRRRMIKLSFAPVQTSALRIKFKDTWGADQVKIYEVRCYS